MRIASWNVLNRNRRLDLIEAFIREADADVIALQELSEDHVTALREIDGYELHLAEDFIEKGELSYLGLMVRAEILAVNTITHNRTREFSPLVLGRLMRWQECLQSQSIHARFDNKNVRIVNVHLSCAVPPGRRMQELTQVAGHFASDEAVILCGDFNAFARPLLNFLVGWAFGSSPRDIAIDERRLIDGFAREHEMTGVFDSVVTLPRFRLHLDHMLVRGMRPRGHTVERHTHGSDHRPLVAKFEF